MLAPDRQLVRDALPTFAVELATLIARDAPELNHQLDGLHLIGRCTCGQTDCATFDVRTAGTVAPLSGHGTVERYSIELESTRGHVILDVYAGRLTSVEVLGRGDVKRQLDAVLPPGSDLRPS